MNVPSLHRSGLAVQEARSDEQFMMTFLCLLIFGTNFRSRRSSNGWLCVVARKETNGSSCRFRTLPGPDYCRHWLNSWMWLTNNSSFKRSSTSRPCRAHGYESWESYSAPKKHTYTSKKSRQRASQVTLNEWQVPQPGQAVKCSLQTRSHQIWISEQA